MSYYKNMKNKIVFAVIAAIAVLIIGFVISSSSENVKGVSSAGVTNTSAKLYTASLVPSTDTATTTSLYNSDSTDRAIVSTVGYCSSVGTSKTFLTGTGLASWLVQLATSSVGNLGLQGNTNYAASLTLSTSSPWVFVSSTTEPVLNAVGRTWPSGTYLNITFNATNTAACTIGVNTVSL